MCGPRRPVKHGQPGESKKKSIKSQITITSGSPPGYTVLSSPKETVIHIRIDRSLVTPIFFLLSGGCAH